MFVSGDISLYTMVNHHQTTIWENMFGTFSRHLIKQIQETEGSCGPLLRCFQDEL